MLLIVGSGAFAKAAHDMLSLDNPALDWVSLARGMGVDGVRVTTDADTSMCDVPSLEKTDQERSRNPEEVGSLLGGQLGLEGNEADGVAVGEFGKHVSEQPRCFPWEHDFLFAGFFHQKSNRRWPGQT